MNNESLLLTKKLDILTEQTKTKPPETLEFKMNKQKQIFSFSPPINLVEEGKCLIGVSSFVCTYSVFNITNKNNSFSITIAGHWQTESTEKNIDELNKFLESQSGIELHVERVKKKYNFNKYLLFV